MNPNLPLLGNGAILQVLSTKCQPSHRTF